MTQQDIDDLLQKYPAWEHVGDTLVGQWKFSDFEELKEVVGKLCDLAAELDHHPTVTFGYNNLKVETTTHDAGNSVTEKDIELVQHIASFCN